MGSKSARKKKKTSVTAAVVDEGAGLAVETGLHLGAEMGARLVLGSVARAPQAVGGSLAGEFTTGAAVRSAAFVTGGAVEGGTQASVAALEATPAAMDAGGDMLGACLEGSSDLLDLCMETAGEVVAGLLDGL